MIRSDRAEVLSTHTPALFAAAVERAASLLREGQVVALPTETVYGLAANAWDAQAVARVYEIKGRPAHNPVIVHVADEAMARDCVAGWPETAVRLARSFWPGPLTLVLPRGPRIPDVITAGGPTVGVRWPFHPFIQAVIHECRFPLAAPSANLANSVSPTNAEHVRRSLGDRLRLIVDGGQSQVGIESTVVDLTTTPPRVLRPGMIHEPALAAVVGELISGPELGAGRFKSPGQLPRHYAPKARLVVWSWNEEAELLSKAKTSGVSLGKVHVIVHSRVPSTVEVGRVTVIPHDAEAYGRALYAELHACDEGHAELIVVEALPAGPEWRALTDRLHRAAAS